MPRLLQTDLVALALTLGLGGLGGALAAWAHLPLGFLLGSLLVSAVLATFDLRPFGKPVTLPVPLRQSFVPVIGVAIGGAFTPEVLAQTPGWTPSLLALLAYIPLAHLIGFTVYSRGGLPRVAAFFGAVPGGLIESVELGAEAGADIRLLTVLQFLRLILTIVLVPLIFWALTGQAVGSASGVRIGGEAVLGWRDAAVLFAAGGLGVMTGRALGLPAWIITGPVLFSAISHGLGWAEGVPPGWLIATTQVVLGTGLGARFAGADHAMLLRAGRLALLNAAIALALAFSFALALRGLTGEPGAAIFLAYAPGGLAEMSLIALSLKMSIAFVTVHHIARIVLAVTVAKVGARWLIPRA